MIEVIIILCTSALGCSVGFIAGGKHYRARWKSALKILEGHELDQLAPPLDLNDFGRDPAPLANPAKSQSNVPPEIDMAQLKELPFFNRVAIEKNRLKAGLGPRDPLHGLPGFAVQEIQEARVKYYEKNSA